MMTLSSLPYTLYACWHPRTPDNTYVYLQDGYRSFRCAACHRERVRSYYRRNRIRILAHKRRYRLLSQYAVEAEIARNARRRARRALTHVR